jgi:light-regulated signal transduction histidine kinase (bacteriophytochrome)
LGSILSLPIRFFIIFQQLNDKKKFPGTGIGLALCRRIVNNHRGDIFRTINKGRCCLSCDTTVGADRNGKRNNIITFLIVEEDKGHCDME